MKKYILTSLCSLICINTVIADAPWWTQSTICRPSNARCYANMGMGFDTELWDSTSDCRGMKLICSAALNRDDFDPIPMTRDDIQAGKNISADFDITLLNTDEGCFGLRKSTSDGAQVLINGKYVNVWCSGILDNVDEQVRNGDITYGAQPTCSELAEYGYVGVINKGCYGKYYDTTQYFIECGGSQITPSRIITLNGADYNSNTTAPTTQSAADEIFDAMYETSQTQHQKYFK